MLMIRDVVFLLLFPSPLHPLLSTNKIHFFRPSPCEGEIDGFVIACSSELENILRHFVSHLSPGRGPFPSKFPNIGLQNVPNYGVFWR